MPGRATTLDGLGTAMASMFDPASVQQGLQLRLAPDDVVISPFGKSGTTWLQQMVHQLRTGGDEDYDDISRVVPWIETAGGLGLDLDASQRGSFRAFKSHLGWDAVPKGGRYIVSLRHPGDALVSMHRFMEGWFLEPGAVSVTEFALVRFIRQAPDSYWAHLAGWWGQKDDPSVLLLAYELMREDLPGTVDRVAAFLGVPMDPALRALVIERSSLAYMQAHKDKFDDLLMRTRSEAVAGVPPGSNSSKVESGRSGSWRDLPEEVLAGLQQRWQEDVTPATGLKDYNAVLAALSPGNG